MMDGNAEAAAPVKEPPAPSAPELQAPVEVAKPKPKIVAEPAKPKMQIKIEKPKVVPRKSELEDFADETMSIKFKDRVPDLRSREAGLKIEKPKVPETGVKKDKVAGEATTRWSPDEVQAKLKEMERAQAAPKEEPAAADEYEQLEKKLTGKEDFDLDDMDINKFIDLEKERRPKAPAAPAEPQLVGAPSGAEETIRLDPARMEELVKKARAMKTLQREQTPQPKKKAPPPPPRLNRRRNPAARRPFAWIRRGWRS